MAGGFDYFYPWERKRVLSKEELEAEAKAKARAEAKIKTMYGIKDSDDNGNSEKSEVVAGKLNSLEAVTTAEDNSQKVSGCVKICASDRERIYNIVVQNLNKRKSEGYSYIQWDEVMETVCLEFPYLEGVPTSRIQPIYFNRNSKRKGHKKRRGVVRFTQRVKDDLYEIVQEHLDPRNNRVKNGDWSDIFEELKGQHPSIKDVGMTTLRSMYYEDRAKRNNSE